jgi:hypothetical protein
MRMDRRLARTQCLTETRFDLRESIPLTTKRYSYVA